MREPTGALSGCPHGPATNPFGGPSSPGPDVYASFTRAVERLGPRWLVLRDVALARGAVGTSLPSRVGIVLLHPERGIALVDLGSESTPHVVECVRRALAIARFEVIFAGRLPIVHLRLSQEDIACLAEAIDAAFGGEPPLELWGGHAWAGLAKRVLSGDLASWDRRQDGGGGRGALFAPSPLRTLAREERRAEPRPPRRQATGTRGFDALGVFWAAVLGSAAGGAAFLQHTHAPDPGPSLTHRSAWNSASPPPLLPAPAEAGQPKFPDAHTTPLHGGDRAPDFTETASGGTRLYAGVTAPKATALKIPLADPAPAAILGGASAGTTTGADAASGLITLPASDVPAPPPFQIQADTPPVASAPTVGDAGVQRFTPVLEALERVSGPESATEFRPGAPDTLHRRRGQEAAPPLVMPFAGNETSSLGAGPIPAAVPTPTPVLARPPADSGSAAYAVREALLPGLSGYLTDVVNGRRERGHAMPMLGDLPAVRLYGRAFNSGGFNALGPLIWPSRSDPVAAPAATDDPHTDTSAAGSLEVASDVGAMPAVPRAAALSPPSPEADREAAAELAAQPRPSSAPPTAPSHAAAGGPRRPATPPAASAARPQRRSAPTTSRCHSVNLAVQLGKTPSPEDIRMLRNGCR